MTATDIDLDALIDALQARAAARARPLTNAAGDEVAGRAAAGLVTVNPGDLITSQWGNLTYQQTFLTFASVADRNNQWAAPAEGARAWTLDTSSPWVYRSGAWHASPAGFVNSATGPATQTDCGSSLTTVVSLAVPVVAGRRYRIYGSYRGQQFTAVGSPQGGISDDLSNNHGICYQYNTPVNAYMFADGFLGYVAATTHTATFSVWGSTNAGANRVLANACSIAVDDIGN